jgi:hypothetical protein
MAEMAFAEHHDMIEAFPAGSSRSTVLRMRFARVIAETSGGLECRSIERGGQISLRMHRRDPGLGIEGFAPSRKPR